MGEAEELSAVEETVEATMVSSSDAGIDWGIGKCGGGEVSEGEGGG